MSDDARWREYLHEVASASWILRTEDDGRGWPGGVDPGTYSRPGAQTSDRYTGPWVPRPKITDI